MYKSMYFITILNVLFIQSFELQDTTTQGDVMPINIITSYKKGELFN